MSKSELEKPIKRQKRNKKEEINMDLPEEIVVNIIARLPLQSIVRFKPVCREWKSFTELAFFRDLYHINYSNSTSCSTWSIHHGDYRSEHSGLEEVKLDLPRESTHGNSSFASCFTLNSINNNKIEETRVVACTDGLVLLRLEPFDDTVIRYYIGNPALPQWIQLPPHCLPREYLPSHRNYNHNDSGLVTRMHNRTLLGYKVVLIHRKWSDSRTWRFEIFSSDTGEWSFKQLLFSTGPTGDTVLNTCNPVSLNGKLHWLDHSGRSIIVHDFFSRDDQVRAISLPHRMRRECYPYVDNPPHEKRICTTSQGYYVLIDAEATHGVNESYNVRIWRLKCDSWSFEMAWEIDMASVGLGRSCVPMAINFFDIDIIYMWDLDSKCFVACNLRANTKSHGASKALYEKEDFLCSTTWSSVLHFVPSLQVLPT